LKATYQATPNLKLEAECQGIKGVFKFLSSADSILGVKECGNCGGTDLSYRFRTPKGYEYYDIRCNNPDCRHEFKFGIQNNEEKTLFPKGWEPPFEGGERDDSRDDYAQDTPPMRRAAAPAATSSGDEIDF